MRALALILIASASLFARTQPALSERPLASPYSQGLEFDEDGRPLVTVGIAGGEEVVLVPRGVAALRTKRGGRVGLEAGKQVRVSVVGGIPGKVRHFARVGEVPFDEKEAVAQAIATWRGRGYELKTPILGAKFAVGGRQVDTRRYALLLASSGERSEAERRLEVARGFGASGSVMEVLAARPSGRIEVRDEEGKLIASSTDVLRLTPSGEEGVVVVGVEHDMGYAAHGREDRIYRGELVLTVGPSGQVAVVNALPLETLLQGIVPSEIFATAPEEALKAQAVAARGEVLAKVGARHLADPFMLCAEQHCQVYKGKAGEHPHTNRAVALTAGEVLLGPKGELVDTVYSSTCGGHTEHNEAVWGTPPSSYLRGRPDLLEGSLPSPNEDLEAFLLSPTRGMCATSTFSRADKYRWTRRFSSEEMNRRAAPLGVGAVEALEVLGRGVSGRATALRFVGTEGEAVVQGELQIRRLLGNLNSSLFVVSEEEGGWLFRGGGWGHGVGMCQMGAIGRAERGEGHASILRHYYQGAAPVRLYGGDEREVGEPSTAN